MIMKSNLVILDFKTKYQMKVFMDWFETYGFDQLCESDSVHDDLPADEFYEKCNKTKIGFDID